MEIVTALQLLGFAEYEARAYIALVKRNPVNGYELAKNSGIPRANIYAVIDRLTARRAVVRLDEPGGTRFAPVPPAELLRRLGGEFQQIANDASRSLEALGTPTEPEAVWNVHGYPALLDQARSAISTAQREVLLAVWPQEASLLKPAVSAAEARDVAITTLCMSACEQECGGCRGRIYRYRVVPASAKRWLVVVPDGDEVVAGEVESESEAFSIKTRQRLVVDVASSYIRRSIALAAVITDLGPRLEELVSDDTRAMLASLDPAAEDHDFLEHMRRLMRGEDHLS
jgi:predicted transcriptional regulator